MIPALIAFRSRVTGGRGQAAELAGHGGWWERVRNGCSLVKETGIFAVVRRLHQKNVNDEPPLKCAYKV